MRRSRLGLGLVAMTLLSCSVIGRPGGSRQQGSTVAMGTPTPTPMSLIDIPDPGLSETPKSAPPFSLTSSDGTGLLLASVSAEASIEDPLALTQLHMTFKNPESRTLEGRFSFTLPEGAAMSRFAMKVNGKWQEAEVVEKQKARQTYEEFLHRKTDPALLEQGAGNEFAVRIFPIAPNDVKEIVVTYSETLRADQPYRMRLAGLASVGKLTAKVSAGGKVLAELNDAEKAPEGDLTVASSAWSAGGPTAIRAGRSVVARVRVPAGDAPADPFESAIVLLDTSASRALDLGQEIAALRSFVKGLAAGTPLKIACFDQSIEEVFSGTAGDFDEEVAKRIRARRALGASDLGAALKWTASTAMATSAHHRVVLFTDGVATAGHTQGEDLEKLTRALGKAGVVRVDAVAVGGLRDEAMLSRLVRGNVERSGVVVGVEAGFETVTRKLATKTLPKMDVSVEGARWSYPRDVELQPGDEVLVYADADAASKPSVKLGASSFEPSFTTGTAPLVERAVAIARIGELEATDDGTVSAQAATALREQRKKEIVELSVKNRVVSEHTSMLVLETDADYDRFKIDRRSKVDVLAVDGGKTRVLSLARGRVADAGAASPADPLRPWGATGNMWGAETGDALGAGGLALTGIGEGGGGRGEGVGLGSVGAIGQGAGTGQGFGSGSGRLSGTHRSRPPQVRMGATSVSGRLPPEVIQRIVRQNFGRFRACYEEGLRKNPNLEGRVSVQFVIGRDGSVSSTRSESSTLDSAETVRCVVRAFTGLTFPQPEGGVITVTYPITFSPGSDREPAPVAMNIPRRAPTQPPPPDPDPPPAPAPQKISPYSGRFATVMDAIDAGKTDDALREALTWRAQEPMEVLALVAIGEAAEARKDATLAARAYGSVLELWSYRVDMRRFAGERLERVGDAPALELAADAYGGAVADRPDHPSSHRLYAMSLLKLGKVEEAFDVLDKALGRTYPGGRFAGVLDVLRGDMGIVGAAWVAQKPSVKEAVASRLFQRGAKLETDPSLRFILVWETDANDVDLHVYDNKENHAYYGHPELPTGGKLTADVTTGYGPEGFIIPRSEDEAAFPYKLGVNYYSRGAMGFGMGKVQVVRHDGKGTVKFDERPFVLMSTGATIDLPVINK